MFNVRHGKWQFKSFATELAPAGLVGLRPRGPGASEPHSQSTDRDKGSYDLNAAVIGILPIKTVILLFSSTISHFAFDLPALLAASAILE